MRATDASKKAPYFTPRRPINPLISPKNMHLQATSEGWLKTFCLLRRREGRSHGPSLAFWPHGSPLSGPPVHARFRPETSSFGDLMPRKFRPAALGGLLACLIGTTLQAAPASDRSITIVVPFGKGTTADLIATVVAEAMSKNIGQKVIVELKPGAGGGLAMEQVEKAAPDGTTLAMITQGTHVFNLSLYKTLRYDPDRIIPITPISAVSNVMTVHPSNPANTP